MKTLNIIKSISSPNKYFRLMSSIAQAAIIYVVFTVVNQMFLLNSDGIHLFSVLLIAMVSGSLWLVLENKGIEISKIKNINIITGLIFCISVSLLGTSNYTLGNISLVFIVNLICWVFAVRKYTFNYSSIFNLKIFYIHASILLISNILTNYNKSIKNYTFEISICTIIYIVLSLFILYELKYLKSPTMISHRKLDFTLVLVLVFIIFLISMLSGLLKYPFILLVYLFKKLLSILLFIISPILKFFIEHFYKLINNPSSEPMELSLSSTGEEAFNPENYHLETLFDKELPFMLLILTTAIGIILFLIICFKKTKKAPRGFEKHIDVINEDTEFLLNKNFLKNLASEALNSFKDNLSSTYDKLTFNFKASINQKIRYEYKLLLKFLYSKKIIVGSNLTAKNISDLLCKNYSSLEVSMKEVTKIYEDVRYSTQEFTKEDLKRFKSNMNCIQSIISKT